MIIRILNLVWICLFAMSIQAQVTSVGIIGPATPIGDWDTDVDMVQDAVDTSIWTLQVTLNDGEIKFRANDGWDVNWGNNDGDFPNGVGLQGEGNLTAFAGDYFITFNHTTGEYTFDYDSDIGLIGPATPSGDWDTDWDMYKDQTDPNKFFTIVDLSADACKFRKDDGWDVNWGANTFPSGTAVLGNGDNITVALATKYRVDFDTLTGVYNFEALVGYDSISLIGAGVTGDWDTDVYLKVNDNDINAWSGVVTMSGGEYKFRANSAWATSWGGPAEFPADTATIGSQDNLVADAGDYFVNFNSETGIYSFEEIEEYGSIGIIGDASPIGDWDTDVDMVQDATDPHMWTLRAILSDGDLKFRANDDWGVNWGGPDFPGGTGELGSAFNIPITGGEYDITFNSITGDYFFKEVIVYDFIGLIGMSGPNADWETDFAMTQDPNDEQVWFIPEATVTTKDPDADDQGVKFRADMDWAVNWGPANADEGWPSGIGVQNGANIPTVEGTYGITLNSFTGEYMFGDVITTTEDIVDPSSITVFPNPTADRLQIDLSSLDLSGTLQVVVVDMAGKTMINTNKAANSFLSLDVSMLQSGHYAIQIVGDNHIIGKRFSVAK